MSVTGDMSARTIKELEEGIKTLVIAANDPTEHAEDRESFRHELDIAVREWETKRRLRDEGLYSEK